MDLDLLVGGYYLGGYLYRFGPLNDRLHLWVRQPLQNMEPELEHPYLRGGRARIHISERAPLPDVFFQQQIRIPITQAALHSCRVIGEINSSILHSLKPCRLRILVIEHSVLPGGPACVRQTPRRSVSLELVSVMSIFDEQIHVPGDVDVDDNGGVILNVVVQSLDILYFEPERLDSFDDPGFG